MLDLGKFLGFGSQRPEKEMGKGPDNLWALGGMKYAVIECKSGVVGSKPINKHDCNQLNGSMAWFAQQYDDTCSATPVMVHPQLTPERAATLPAGTRIVTVADLANLTGALKDYSVAISKAGYSNAKTVSAQLEHFGLDKENIIQKFSSKAKPS